jgi:hypothetical protein
MQYIPPLIEGPAPRDVLVNVMFDHIRRFKDDPRSFLREQMRDFFGLGDEELPEGLDEEQLFALYRSKLKTVCGVTFAADLAIPDPTASRTKFRLVAGGKHRMVAELFREIERNVIGREAAVVRDDATARKAEMATGQLTLVAAPPSTDPHYDVLHEKALIAAPEALKRMLQNGSKRFELLWPRLLEEHHLTKTELARLAWSLHQRGQIAIANAKPRERTVNDLHVLELTGP